MLKDDRTPLRNSKFLVRYSAVQQPMLTGALRNNSRPIKRTLSSGQGWGEGGMGR